MRSAFLRLENGLFALVETLLFLMTVALIVVVALQVVFRYVLSNSLYWSVEATRFLFVWIVFLGAAIAVRQDNHVGIDLVVKAVPVAVARAMGALVAASVLIFLLVGVYFGWKVTLTTATSPSESLRVSYAWLYSSLPVSSVLMIIAYACRWLRGKEGGAA